MLLDTGNDVYFSAASVWEISIKSGSGRGDFDADPADVVETLLGNGFAGLAVTAAHAARVAALPKIHRDPFDRLLVAQSLAEPMTLLTSDRLLASYGSTIRVV